MGLPSKVQDHSSKSFCIFPNIVVARAAFTNQLHEAGHIFVEISTYWGDVLAVEIDKNL